MDCNSGDVTFVAFSTEDSAPAARSATIATYAPPMGCGRTRGSRAALRTAAGRCSASRRKCWKSWSASAGSRRRWRRSCSSANREPGRKLAAQLLHRAQRAEQRAVCQRELRRDSRQPGRGRAVRLRARSLHRRGAPASGLFRAGLRRNAFPRRDHRDADRPAGKAAARARDRTHGSRRRHPGDRHRRPCRDGEQSPAGRGGPRSPSARGPLLPACGTRSSACRRCGSAATISSCWPTRSSPSSIESVGTAKRFDPAALAVARAHSWPGNVRELKNCVERSYVLSDDVVRLDVQPALDLADGIRIAAIACACRLGRRWPMPSASCSSRPCGTAGGNKRRTADVLGVSLKTVYNKLVGYGIATPMLRTAGDARGFR